MELRCVVGHCFECKIPIVMINGVMENPTSSNVVIVFDFNSNGDPRATLHYSTCEQVCTMWNDCDTIDAD